MDAFYLHLSVNCGALWWRKRKMSEISGWIQTQNTEVFEITVEKY